jgi:hypothetical protein
LRAQPQKAPLLFYLFRALVPAVEDAVEVVPGGRADERKGHDEHDGADGARLALEEEAGQVEHHEHGVVVEEGGVHGLGDQQDGDEPLEAVHPEAGAGGRLALSLAWAL